MKAKGYEGKEFSDMEKLPGVVWDVSHKDVDATKIHRHRQAVEAAHEHYLLGATADVVIYFPLTCVAYLQCLELMWQLLTARERIYRHFSFLQNQAPHCAARCVSDLAPRPHTSGFHWGPPTSQAHWATVASLYNEA